MKAGQTLFSKENWQAKKLFSIQMTSHEENQLKNQNKNDLKTAHYPFLLKTTFEIQKVDKLVEVL